MGTFKTVNPGDQPVWINTDNCKACDKCVADCPAGVLAMVYEQTSVLGKMISIVHPDACIGCGECESICPDFAIFVADKKEFKAAGHKFAKLTDESKTRQDAIVDNNYMSLEGA